MYVEELVRGPLSLLDSAVGVVVDGGGLVIRVCVLKETHGEAEELQRTDICTCTRNILLGVMWEGTYAAYKMGRGVKYIELLLLMFNESFSNMITSRG